MPNIMAVSGRSDEGGPEATAPGRPSLLVGAGHLAALWALAFAEPLFDLLGRNADFFVARGNDGSDILVFSFAFTLVPPLVMLAVEAVAQRIDPRARWAIHMSLVTLLVAALALQIEEKIANGPGGLLIAVALVVGALAAIAYARTRFLRGVAESGHGSLVMVASTAGLFGEAGHADYAAAKSAIAYGLLLSLKNEIVRVAPGARVNVVCPGWTYSPMTRGAIDDELVDRITRTMPLRKVAEPDDVANQVVVLASDEISGHVTGQVVTVAGGMEGRVVHD